MKPPKVADAPRGIDRYEVRAVDRNLIRAIERRMWLDHGHELGDGEYGEPDIARTLHWLLTEQYLDKGWHVGSFDDLAEAIRVAHGCNRSDARAVYFTADRMPGMGYRVEGPALPPEMAMRRHREYMDRWFDAIRDATGAAVDRAIGKVSNESLMQKTVPTFRVGALDTGDGKWTTDHASELAAHPPKLASTVLITDEHVEGLAGAICGVCAHPHLAEAPELHQGPPQPGATVFVKGFEWPPRRKQSLRGAVARMAVDGITIPTLKPKEDR